MKTRTSLILFLFVLISCLRLSAQPQIAFDTTMVDLGVIPQGSPADYTYSFTNSGDSPLVLTSVKSSCGCVVPYWPKDVISPGERGEVKAKYDSQRIGPCVKSLTVQSNDPTNPIVVLTLKCNVFPLDQRLEFKEVTSSSPFVEDPQASGSEIEGGAQCRPCFPPPTADRYVLRVYNPNSQIARLDLSAYNDPVNGHFGAFFSEDAFPGMTGETLRSNWGNRCSDKWALQPQGYIYLVVHDRAWLAQQIFNDDLGQWAMPIGVAWEYPPSVR